MYPIVSSVSFLIRFYLCYVTIEQLPLFANEAIGWVFGQIVSIYVLFRIVCYPIVGIISDNLEIRSASAKSVLYFLLYIPLAGLYWIVLLLFTNVFHILPIQ
jgi:hypothetical protein